MRFFASTDIGKARETNQDYYELPNSEDELKLFILADGMGGYNGGEIASKLAVDAAKRYITNNFEETEKDKIHLQELIKSAIEYANMVIYEKALKNEELTNMGTTLEICLIYNNRAYIGHVGDSRIYRIRKQIIRKLTEDHSYVQKLVKDGTITKQEALHHPKKNMLMKAVGCAPFVEPDVMVKGALKDDIFIMTSDGLTNMVSNEEIYEIVINYPETADKELINLANQRGGYDNITVIILQN